MLPAKEIWLLMVLSTAATAFIRHGTLVDEKSGKYRYNVLVAIDMGNDQWKMCSGTVLSPRVVYTACHCITGIGTNANGQQQPITYHRGFVRVYKGGEITPQKEVRVMYSKVWIKEHCYIPPHWIVDPSKDYGLVFLDEAIDEKLGEKMCESATGPVAPLFGPKGENGKFSVLTLDNYLLPPQQASRRGRDVKPEVDCRSVGYGDSEDEESSPDSRLRVTTRLVHVEEIARSSISIYKYLMAIFQKSAKGEISGTCEGDSGTSLICSIDNKPYLLGTLSGSTVDQKYIQAREQHQRTHPNGPPFDPDFQFKCVNQENEQKYSHTADHFTHLYTQLNTEGYWKEVREYQVKCDVYYEKNGFWSPPGKKSSSTSSSTTTTTSTTTPKEVPVSSTDVTSNSATENTGDKTEDVYEDNEGLGDSVEKENASTSRFTARLLIGLIMQRIHSSLSSMSLIV